MKKNMVLIDKVIRIVVEVIMIGAGIVLHHDGHRILPVLLYIFAGIFILTSLFGVCLLYIPFGINTRAKE